MDEARARRRRAPGEKTKPEPVGGVVEALFARLGIAAQVERASVIPRWEDLVGPRIARVARPTGLDGGTLFVEVESAAWRSELSLLRPSLMRKLNAGKRAGKIDRIVFLQADGRISEEPDGGEAGRA
jgi:predicted nucleic acid-binding Zn ribbon protein